MASNPQQVSGPRIPPEELQKILASQPFIRSQRMCRFMSLLVERANRGNPEGIKETEIGVLVFDREVGYDPKIDSIVRTEATRLRRKLSEYYAAEGRENLRRLHLPPGRYELELLPHVHPIVVQTTVQQRAARPLYRPAIAVGLVLLGLLVWLLQVRAPHVVSLTPLTFFPGAEDHPSFSADGKRVAYTWDGENASAPAIYVQALGSDTPVRLTRSRSEEYYPAWSPDGSEIAFLRRIAADRVQVRKVRASPGSAGDAGDTLLCEIQARSYTIPGLSWSPDGSWLATAEASGPNNHLILVLISPQTGEKRIHRQPPEKISLVQPVFSPDGRNLAYVRNSDTAVSDVFVAGFPSGPERQITFDHAVVSGLAWSGPREILVASSRGGLRSSLWRVPLTGAPVRLTEGAQDSVHPAVSRDGSTLAFSRSVEDINVWRRKLGGDNPGDSGEPWLNSSGLDSSPQFSPDGSQVAFRSNRTGPNEIWIAEKDGRTVRKLTSFGGPVTGSPRWSPDGKWLAFDSRASGDSDIWVVLATGGEPRRLTPESSNESLPSWSRDGRFIYYNSDSTGARSMWRRPWNGGEPQLIRQRACAGWESPDGRYLYYVHTPSEAGLFRMPLSGGPEEAIIPRLSPGMWGNWAFGRNGIYFVDWVITPAGREGWAQFQDASGAAHKVFRVSHPVGWDGAVAVSPDETWLAYAQVDRSGSDILLMKDWK